MRTLPGVLLASRGEVQKIDLFLARKLGVVARVSECHLSSLGLSILYRGNLSEPVPGTCTPSKSQG